MLGNLVVVFYVRYDVVILRRLFILKISLSQPAGPIPYHHHRAYQTRYEHREPASVHKLYRICGKEYTLHRYKEGKKKAGYISVEALMAKIAAQEYGCHKHRHCDCEAVCGFHTSRRAEQQYRHHTTKIEKQIYRRHIKLPAKRPRILDFQSRPKIKVYRLAEYCKRTAYQSLTRDDGRPCSHYYARNKEPMRHYAIERIDRRRQLALSYYPCTLPEIVSVRL